MIFDDYEDFDDWHLEPPGAMKALALAPLAIVAVVGFGVILALFLMG